MKRLYEHYVATGQTARAEDILSIPRYKNFVEKKVEKVEEKPKVEPIKSKEVK